jgi:hypothetical protein
MVAAKLDSSDKDSSTPVVGKSKSDEVLSNTYKLIDAASVGRAVGAIIGAGVAIPAQGSPPKTPSGESEETGDSHSSPSTGDSVKDSDKSIVKETMIMAEPQIKIRAPGVVDMLPGILVKLEGASVFDKSYVVLGVKHSLSSGGYDMEVDLITWTGINGSVAPKHTEVADKSTNTDTAAPVSEVGKAYQEKNSTADRHPFGNTMEPF